MQGKGTNQPGYFLKLETKANTLPALRLTTYLTKEILFFFLLHPILFLSGAFHTKTLKSQGMGGIFLFRNPPSGNYVKNVSILWVRWGWREKKGLIPQDGHFSENRHANVGLVNP